MAGTVHERVLAAEMVTVMAIETADALYGTSGGQFSLPSPSQYFATMIVYGMLAAVAMFGEKPGRLAGAFGGVAALAILLAPGKNGKPPVVIGALDYFNSIMTGGTLGPGSSGSGSGSSAPVIGSSNTANPGQAPGTPAPIQSVGPPAGAPSGTYGVDPNGTIYKKNSAGQWGIYTTPGQTSPLTLS